MFDFDTTKLLLIGIVALAVIPPKDLPRVIRQVGQAVGKVRRMASEFQGQVMEALKEAELDDLKKEITSITDSAKAEVTAITDAAKVDIDIDPAGDAKREITKAIEADPVREMGGGAADVYARATAAPSVEAPALPPVNEHALAMPDVPPPLAVTHETIAAQAGLTPLTQAKAPETPKAPQAFEAPEAPKAVRTIDLRKPEAAAVVPKTAALAHTVAIPTDAPAAEEPSIAAQRKRRIAPGYEANGHSAPPAALEMAEQTTAVADGGERVPYRKRFGYVAPARAARAARREG